VTATLLEPGDSACLLEALGAGLSVRFDGGISRGFSTLEQRYVLLLKVE